MCAPPLNVAGVQNAVEEKQWCPWSLQFFEIIDCRHLSTLRCDRQSSTRRSLISSARDQTTDDVDFGRMLIWTSRSEPQRILVESAAGIHASAIHAFLILPG